MAERGRPGDADESQGEEDQGDGCHPCLLVGDASQDGIESQKIPLGHDVRWGGEWVGIIQGLATTDARGMGPSQHRF